MNWSLSWDWSWQEWAVAVLIVLCILQVVIRTRSFFQKINKKTSPCDSCASGCELKNQLNKKQQKCKNTPSLEKKKYSG